MVSAVLDLSFLHLNARNTQNILMLPLYKYHSMVRPNTAVSQNLQINFQQEQKYSQGHLKIYDLHS